MDVKDWYRIFAWLALASQSAILAIWIARAVGEQSEGFFEDAFTDLAPSQTPSVT